MTTVLAYPHRIVCQGCDLDLVVAIAQDVLTADHPPAEYCPNGGKRFKMMVPRLEEVTREGD